MAGPVGFAEYSDILCDTMPNGKGAELERALEHDNPVVGCCAHTLVLVNYTLDSCLCQTCGMPRGDKKESPIPTCQTFMNLLCCIPKMCCMLVWCPCVFPCACITHTAGK